MKPIKKFRAGDKVKQISGDQVQMTVVGYTKKMVHCAWYSGLDIKFVKYLLPEDSIEKIVIKP